MRVLRIVSAITLVTLLVVGGAFVGVRAWSHGGRLPLRPWVIGFIALDAALLYGTFEPRAALFGRVLWRGRADRPAVAITFDDGPNEPYTSQILDVLRAFDVKATFFVLGAKVERFPAAAQRAVEEGHEVGNHTYDHQLLPLKSSRFITHQLRITSDGIKRVTGTRPRLFRAPHGWRNPWVDRVARREGCITVAWTIGVYDTARPGVNCIIERALKGLKNGCILLLHDGRGVEAAPDASQVVEALPVILREARRRGYRLVTVSELADDAKAG